MPSLLSVPAPVAAQNVTASRALRLKGAPANWFYLAGGGRTDPAGGPARDVFDLATGLVGTRSGPGASFANGPYGRCLGFDGSSWATVPRATLTAEYTLTVVVNLKSAALAGTFFQITHDGGVGIGVGTTTMDSPGNRIVGTAEGIAWYPTGVSYGLGWHAVSMQAKGSSVLFFLDGVLVNTLANVGFSDFPAQLAGIGGYPSSSAQRTVSAQIADVKYYNYALTPAQVARDHADPYWRLRPYPTTLEWLGTPQNPIVLAAAAGPSTTSLGLFAAAPPNAAILAAQAAPATLGFTINVPIGPLVAGAFGSVEIPTASAVNPWDVDPEETILLN